jgi:acetylglutamate kinase
VVAQLDSVSLEGALAHPDVQGGMRPKLNAARTALEAGVPRVHIAAWSGPGTLRTLIGGEGAGTTILASAEALVGRRSQT